MIPQTIHYVWLGRNPKPRAVKTCMKSWKRYCPGYKIMEWNEDNLPAFENKYFQQAYEAKKWAYASDYVRLWVIYHYGGIYLDTDVELIRPLDELRNHACFLCRKKGSLVNTGLGFGAEKGHPIIKAMLDGYEGIPFVKENGELDLESCPSRNSQCLIQRGMLLEDIYQEIEGAAIYPQEYFDPIDVFTRQTVLTPNTYSIHQNNNPSTWGKRAVWWENGKKYVYFRYIDPLIHTPNRVLKKLLGASRYEKLKLTLKGDKSK